MIQNLETGFRIRIYAIANQIRVFVGLNKIYGIEIIAKFYKGTCQF